jgi:hypothetical protein
VACSIYLVIVSILKPTFVLNPCVCGVFFFYRVVVCVDVIAYSADRVTYYFQIAPLRNFPSITGATRGTGTAYPPEHMSSPPVLVEIVLRDL